MKSLTKDPAQEGDLQERDAAASPEAEQAPEGASTPTRRRGPTDRTWRRIIVALAVLALGLAAAVGFEAWQGRDEGGLAEQHREVARAAEAETVAFLSVDHRDMDAAIDKVLDGATGDFKKDYAARREEIIEAATLNKSISTGEVVALGVGEMDDDSALVYVAANSEVSNTSTDGTKQPRYYRLQLDMTLVDGRWLASDVKFVG
ncbi:hypothetical protein [Nocardioides pacificus]